MKVSLTINNRDCLNGYLNLDPFVTEPGSSKVKSDVANLDEHLDKAECSELKAYGILTYFDSNKVDAILDNWISKIRMGGIIDISDIDLERAYKAHIRGEITITQLNDLLWGEQIHTWDLRKCGLNLDSVSQALRAKGLEIIEKTFVGYNFIVKAKRVK